MRSRLRQLLTIPERDRTDEEWDAIVAIEIELGPGKPIGQGQPKGQNPQQGQPSSAPRHPGKQNKAHWKPGKKPKGPPAA
jgi:hypothetical protein